MTRNEAIELLSSKGSRLEVAIKAINGVKYQVYHGEIKTLRDLYEVNAEDDETTLLVYENNRFSFRGTYLKSVNLAWRLKEEFGIQKGDRIAIASRNYPEWCMAYMAITAMNCIAVALNAWWSGEELLYGLQDSGAKLVFADAERIERLRPLISDIDLQLVAIRPAGADPETDIATLFEGDQTTFPPVEIDPEDNATILYTSGSTGKPKGVLSSHRAVLTPVVAWVYTMGIEVFTTLPQTELGPWKQWLFQETDTLPEIDPKCGLTPAPEIPGMLLTFPLFHVSGLIVQFLASVLWLRKLVIMKKWNPEKALELIEREKLTAFDGVPTQSWDLINSPDFEKRDTSTLLNISAGGAKRPVEQAKQIENSFDRSLGAAGYGLTETNGLGTSISGEDYVDRPASIGRPLEPFVEIEIRDHSGNSLLPNNEGEVCIKSCALFAGYWNKPDATADVFRDGWFRTGDLGYLDEEGFVFITGRAKNIVIRGGENIGCDEVEEVLHEHPAIFEAVVFGLPDERLGEILGARVMVAPGQTTDEDELKWYVGTRLAKFKVPAVIWLQTDPLPRIASGKVDTVRLKKEAESLVKSDWCD